MTKQRYLTTRGTMNAHRGETTGALQSKKHSSSGDQMIFQSKLTDIVITEPDSVDATRHG